MITWFQRYFGKHNKWILMAFLVVLLISFIISIGAVPRGAMTGARQSARPFLGVDLNSTDDMKHLQLAVMFTTELNGGQLQNDQQLTALMDERIALKYTADQWQIPEPTEKQVDDYVRALPAFLDASGNFSPDHYVAFRDNLQAKSPAERDEYITILHENCRLERARNLLGGPGYRVPGVVLPALMQIANAEDNFKYDLEAATLDRSKFDAKIDEKEPELTAALTKLFESTPNRFQHPPQVDLALVSFPSAPVPTPTPAQLADYLSKHKDAFPEITSAVLSPADSAKVAKAWSAEQKDIVLGDAKTAAMKFAKEAADLNLLPGSPAFDVLLKKYQKTLQPLPTLTQGTSAPANSPVASDDLLEVAFNLGPQNPMSPIPTTDGAGILFFVKGQPARASTFAEAREDVLKAYREQEKSRLISVHGDELNAAITKAMTDGKTFREAAEAQGLTVKNYTGVTDADLGAAAMVAFNPAADKDTAPANALAAMGNDLIAALTEPDANHVPLLLTLQPGSVSKMLFGKDVGVVFHVLKRAPAEIAADSPEFKMRLDGIARQESNFAAIAYLKRVLIAAQATLKPSGS